MTIPPLTFAPGTATGVGSLPGTDPIEAARTVLGELPQLPHLPELPARGPGADMIGRSAAALVDLHVDLQPSGWRFVDRRSRDERLATSFLGQDLDALEEAAQGYSGLLKVQLAGPWTLAATIELSHGDKALSDTGACRDLTASLAEAVTGHLDDLRRRLPAAEPVVQLDEPSLPAVLAGRVRTASGFGALRAVEEPDAEAGLRAVVDAVHAGGARAVVHCCAADVPVSLLRRAGADGVSLDVSLLPRSADEALGEAVEGGLALLMGAVPTAPSEQRPSSNGKHGAGSVEWNLRPIRGLWRRLGLSPGLLRTGVAVTPACGLAGASPAGARAALVASRDAARSLAEEPEA